MRLHTSAFFLMMIVFGLADCKNQPEASPENNLAKNEIEYLSQKIDTIVYLFALDGATSALKPSVFINDLFLFYTYFNELIPPQEDYLSIDLLNDSCKLQLFNIGQAMDSLQTFDFIRKEYKEFLYSLDNGLLDKEMALVLLKRIEFTIVFELYLKQCDYKNCYVKDINI
jgi:hypothetical protein